MGSVICYEGEGVSAYVMKRRGNMLKLYITGCEQPIIAPVESFLEWCEENDMKRIDFLPGVKIKNEEAAWRKGQKKELADRLEISKQHMNNIIHRRRRISFEMAQRIEEELAKMGIETSAMDWILGIGPLFPEEAQYE